MADIDKILDHMRSVPASVRFAELLKICEVFFGAPRRSGGSHVVFKTPWFGDPRINLQTEREKPKPTKCAKCFWPSRG